MTNLDAVSRRVGRMCAVVAALAAQTQVQTAASLRPQWTSEAETASRDTEAERVGVHVPAFPLEKPATASSSADFGARPSTASGSVATAGRGSFRKILPLSASGDHQVRGHTVRPRALVHSLINVKDIRCLSKEEAWSAVMAAEAKGWLQPGRKRRNAKPLDELDEDEAWIAISAAEKLGVRYTGSLPTAANRPHFEDRRDTVEVTDRVRGSVRVAPVRVSAFLAPSPSMPALSTAGLEWWNKGMPGVGGTRGVSGVSDRVDLDAIYGAGVSRARAPGGLSASSSSPGGPGSITSVAFGSGRTSTASRLRPLSSQLARRGGVGLQPFISPAKQLRMNAPKPKPVLSSQAGTKGRRGSTATDATGKSRPEPFDIMRLVRSRKMSFVDPEDSDTADQAEAAYQAAARKFMMAFTPSTCSRTSVLARPANASSAELKLPFGEAQAQGPASLTPAKKRWQALMRGSKADAKMGSPLARGRRNSTEELQHRLQKRMAAMRVLTRTCDAEPDSPTTLSSSAAVESSSRTKKVDVDTAIAQTIQEENALKAFGWGQAQAGVGVQRD